MHRHIFSPSTNARHRFRIPARNSPARDGTNPRRHGNRCLSNLFFSLFVLLDWTLFGASGLAADISGRVRLEGTPPPEKLVDLTDFQDVARAYPALIGKLSTRHYLLGEGGGLANVFVYVKKGLEGRAYPPTTNVVVLDQTNAVFHPYVLGLRTKQTLVVRNSEPYLDTPQCESTNNKPFNFAQPMTGMEGRHTFERPEVLIRVKCGIHIWEFAFIGVVEHPFFAVSGADGRYAFPSGLPPGKYLIEAVHPKAGRLTREMTVSEIRQQAVDFTFTVPAPKR